MLTSPPLFQVPLLSKGLFRAPLPHPPTLTSPHRAGGRDADSLCSDQLGVAFPALSSELPQPMAPASGPPGRSRHLQGVGLGEGGHTTSHWGFPRTRSHPPPPWRGCRARLTHRPLRVTQPPLPAPSVLSLALGPPGRAGVPARASGPGYFTCTSQTFSNVGTRFQWTWGGGAGRHSPGVQNLRGGGNQNLSNQRQILVFSEVKFTEN